MIVLNPTVLIPTPFVFSVGIIIGGTLLIPLDGWRIVTFESPRVYLSLISNIGKYFSGMILPEEVLLSNCPGVTSGSKSF